MWGLVRGTALRLDGPTDVPPYALIVNHLIQNFPALKKFAEWRAAADVTAVKLQ